MPSIFCPIWFAASTGCCNTGAKSPVKSRQTIAVQRLTCVGFAPKVGITPLHLHAETCVVREPRAHRGVIAAANFARIAVMASEPLQRQLQHDLGRARTRWRAPITTSVKLAARWPRRPEEIGLSQFDVVRGISCARVNSARSRSPACNWCGSISARPSRPRRRASQASQAFGFVDGDAGAAVLGLDLRVA